MLPTRSQQGGLGLTPGAAPSLVSAMLRPGLFVLAAALAVGCNPLRPLDPADAPAGLDVPLAACGNAIVEAGEDCDPPDGFLCDPACASAALAGATVFRFTGHVTLVDSAPISVAVGDAFTGYYVYGPAADSNGPSDVGVYSYLAPGYGIMVVINGVRFYSNQASVNFRLELVNRSTDNYLLRSYSNTSSPVLDEGVDHISWQLDDNSGTALSSDALPTAAPVLSQWSQVFGLEVEGADPNYYRIRGVIDTVGP